MPWVRFEDSTPDHPKIAALDDASFRSWFDGMAYCNRLLTDGFIPKNVAMKLARPKSIQQLLKQLLWVEVDGGYEVHDYLEYQPSKQKVLTDRSNKQTAGQAGGQASATARAQAKSNPVPVPNTNTRSRSRPVPHEQQPRAGVREEPPVVGLHRDYLGSPEGKEAELEAYSDVGLEVASMAFQEAVRSDGRSWWYVKRILDRWRLADIIHDPAAVTRDLEAAS